MPTPSRGPYGLSRSGCASWRRRPGVLKGARPDEDLVLLRAIAGGAEPCRRISRRGHPRGHDVPARVARPSEPDPGYARETCHAGAKVTRSAAGGEALSCRELQVDRGGAPVRPRRPIGATRLSNLAAACTEFNLTLAHEGYLGFPSGRLAAPLSEREQSSCQHPWPLKSTCCESRDSGVSGLRTSGRTVADDPRKPFAEDERALALTLRRMSIHTY